MEQKKNNFDGLHSKELKKKSDANYELTRKYHI